MGRYNPNYPTVLGNEFAPVTTSPETINTGTAFGYTFRSQEQEDVATARVLMTEPPPGKTLRKNIAVEVYGDAGAPGTGPIRKIIVPVSSASSYVNAAVVGGGTMANALKNPTDAVYVSLTGPSAGVRIYFDTSTTNTKLHSAIGNGRILDVTVRYLIAGQFEEFAVPVVMALERASAGVAYDLDVSITGENFQNENVVPRTARLGDYNPFWNTTVNPNTDMRRAPWMLNNGSNNHIGLEALQSSSGTNIGLRFVTSPDVGVGIGAFNVHYVALEITYCAIDTRLAAGALDLTPGLSLTDDMFHADVPLYSIINYGFPWSSEAEEECLLTVGQAYVGAYSVTYPVPVTVDRLASARDTFRGHRGVIINKTLREGEEWTREDIDAIPAVVLYASTVTFDAATIYEPSQVYNAQIASPVAQLTFPGESLQWIDELGVTGATYTHVRFYARNFEQTRDYLEVFLTNISDVPIGPRAQITVEEFEALPEIANGWKEVTLELETPWVTAGLGPVKWQFGGATLSTSPWEVLGADSQPYRDGSVGTSGGYYAGTYGGGTSYAEVDNVQDFWGDISLMLIQALEVPGNLAVTPAVQDLSLIDEACGLPVTAIPTGIRYHQISWDPVNDLAVAGFAYYEVQRRDTTMPADEWETVGQVTTVASTDMDDYEARVGVVSSYRVRQVHEDGYTSAWSATATSTITAPGVTGTGVEVSVLILTSNQNPAGNLAHVMSWPGSTVPTQDFQYPESGQTVYESMYGRDYQVAFRPLERGGVEFTRTLLLNAAGVPTLTLDKSALALRDLAWETVPYVCTRDQMGNRWLAGLEVPSSATRDVPSAGHLVLAPVTFTEVTATPAPVDVVGPCEGARLEGLDLFQYWTTDAPAAMGGTRVQTDTFTRVVANGWGSSDTGEAWTAAGGVAADFSVTGTQGSIISSTVTADRTVVAADTYDYHLTKVSFTVPAVATAGIYHAGLITRWQDASNYYLYKIEFATAGTFRLVVVRVLAGVATTLDTGAAISTYTAGTVIHLEEMTRGTTLTARVWKDAGTPPNWGTGSSADVVYLPAQTSLPMTGRVGVLQNRNAANTNVNLTLLYDNFTVDSLPEVYDLRAFVRPFADDFTVQYGTDEFTLGGDENAEGSWSLHLGFAELKVSIFGNDLVFLTTTDLTGLGLVKNRETWVRVVITQDDGTGTMTADWYTLADDGVTWTLVDTSTQAAPAQPIPPFSDDVLFYLRNTAPGGIWTKKVELRLDGVMVLDPNFAAQAIGTEAFTDATGNDWSTVAGRGICATLE